jgi:hypothetical protein
MICFVLGLLIQMSLVASPINMAQCGEKRHRVNPYRANGRVAMKVDGMSLNVEPSRIPRKTSLAV